MPFIYSILPEYTQLSDKYNDYSLYGEYPSLQGYTDAIDENIFEILMRTRKVNRKIRYIYIIFQLDTS